MCYAEELGEDRWGRTREHEYTLKYARSDMYEHIDRQSSTSNWFILISQIDVNCAGTGTTISIVVFPLGQRVINYKLARIQFMELSSFS